jgi:hypothetical protein
MRQLRMAGESDPVQVFRPKNGKQQRAVLKSEFFDGPFWLLLPGSPSFIFGSSAWVTALPAIKSGKADSLKNDPIRFRIGWN